MSRTRARKRTSQRRGRLQLRLGLDRWWTQEGRRRRTRRRRGAKNLLKERNEVRPRPRSASRNSRDRTGTLSPRVSSPSSTSSSTSTSTTSSSSSTSSSTSTSSSSSSSSTSSTSSSFSTSSTSSSATTCSSSSSTCSTSSSPSTSSNPTAPRDPGGGGGLPGEDLGRGRAAGGGERHCGGERDAEPPNSRATEPPSNRAAEPPDSRAAQQPSRPTAEPPSSQAAEPPCRRAATLPTGAARPYLLGLCVPPDPGIEAAALGAGEAAALGASASAAPGAGESALSGTTSAQAFHTFTLDSGASRSFFRDRTTLTPLSAGEAAALGASASAAPGAGESALSGTTSAQAFHTFTLDSGASRSFFRDRTMLTRLSRPVAVSLADPSGGPVLASFSTILPGPAAPSGTLSGLYLPLFSTNLVSGADLQDRGVDQFTPASQRCDSKDGLSLFDLTSGASTAPAADADCTVRSQWLTRDAAARLAVRNHLPSTERAHFSHYKSARALYDAVVARYSSPTTAALSRLMLPYLFPDLAAFATVADLVAHLRTSDARYRAALPTEFLPTNSPPMYITLYYLVTRLPDSLSSARDHFLSLARGAPCCS
ncbi:unnamed protein product [Closterium sp. NIES-54]